MLLRALAGRSLLYPAVAGRDIPHPLLNEVRPFPGRSFPLGDICLQSVTLTLQSRQAVRVPSVAELLLIAPSLQGAPVPWHCLTFSAAGSLSLPVPATQTLNLNFNPNIPGVRAIYLNSPVGTNQDDQSA